MNAFSLLIDLGGTDIKFALAEGDQLVSESIKRFSIPPFLDETRKTISCELFINLITEQTKEYLLAEDAPQRILVTGQMGSWILTDSEGLPLTDLVSWQSTISASNEILESIYTKEITSPSEPLSGSGGEDWMGAPWRTVPLFISMLESKPKEIYFHSLISWTIWELTNKSNHKIHVTDAASTGMYSQAENKWMGSFESLGTRVVFPQVLKKIESIGTLHGGSVPVYAGIADQQASLYGVGLNLQSFVINAGTGGQVARLTAEYSNTDRKVRPYFDGNYIETITHIPSGRYIKRFVEFIKSARGEDLNWEWICQRGHVNRNHALRMKVLDWDYDRFLSFIDPKATTEELADDLIEQICQNFISKLESLGCKPTDEVFLAGGIATRLRRLKDLLILMEVKIRETESDETTLDGLAKLSKRITNQAGQSTQLER